MKKITITYLPIICMLLLLVMGCSKEERLIPSDDLDYAERFAPDDSALPGVKRIYKDYTVWLRMDFEDAKEVTNAILVDDVNNRFGAVPIDEDRKESAIMFVDTLLHNVSVDFVKRVFPREFFFVKTYNGSFWKADIQAIGRTRLVVCWPNERQGIQPITIPETHYYQDSVMTRMVWGTLSGMLSQRIDGEIPEFEAAGIAYDNGQALDELQKNFPREGTDEEYEAMMERFAAERGYISASGSRGYEQDLAQWVQLLVTESYDNIKIRYLDTSDKRAAKYELLVDYFKKEYNWDIQETGNKYRRELDKFN